MAKLSKLVSILKLLTPIERAKSSTASMKVRPMPLPLMC